MQIFLADTSIFISHFRNFSPATKFLTEEHIVVSSVTIGELLQGARNLEEQKMIINLIKQYEINWGSAEINQKSIALLKQHYLSHHTHLLDTIIAATALLHSYILATDNIKHFRIIKGLHLKPLSSFRTKSSESPQQE